MEELTKLMHEMWFNNEISKEAYAKLLIFTNTHNNLQLLQTDVSSSFFCTKTQNNEPKCKTECKFCKDMQKEYEEQKNDY